MQAGKKSSRILIISISSMQISIMEISMSLNGNLVLSWGITQPTEKTTIGMEEKPTFKFVEEMKSGKVTLKVNHFSYLYSQNHCLTI